MKLQRIQLTNIRCFASIDLDFSVSGKSSVVFTGDNSAGKSTLLRAIAMGLCEPASSSALLLELPGEFIRKNRKKGGITLELSIGRSLFKIKTVLESYPTFEKFTQFYYKLVKDKWVVIDDRKFPWRRIFVTAYGPGIRILGTSDYESYFAVDALYPLFNYTHPLQQPELVLRRLVAATKDEKRILEQFQNLLSVLLNLPSSDGVILTNTGLVIRKGSGLQIGLASQGDGYRSVITWVLDLISWWLLRNKLNHKKLLTDLVDIEGIVIVDEIEQHLHPKLQLEILTLLKNSFPNVQFLTATHSPLILSGVLELQTYILTEGKIAALKLPTFGWQAEDIYRDVLGIPSSRALKMHENIETFRRLDMKKTVEVLSEDEIIEFRTLKELINKSLPQTDLVTTEVELDNIDKLLKGK